MEVTMNRLINAINDMKNIPDSEKVNMGGRGKLYLQVAHRVSIFRKHLGLEGNIKSEVIFSDLERVVVKAIITVYQHGVWVEVANGYAEEFRGQGPVNKTSAIENCETSAIGRALANLGLHGGEYASAFEMDNSINNKEPAPDLKTRYVGLNEKKAKMVSFTDINAYMKWISNNIGNPADEKCLALWNANASTIKKVYEDLPEGDNHRQNFSDLIDAYEQESE